MKLRKVLRRMNKIDQALLLILALTFILGAILSGVSPGSTPAQTGKMTVYFEDAPESFGKEALPGSPVIDRNSRTVGYVVDFSPQAGGVLLTMTANADFEGAVGEQVFLRGKHFEGTGRIKSLLTSPEIKKAKSLWGLSPLGLR